MNHLCVNPARGSAMRGDRSRVAESPRWARRPQRGCPRRLAAAVHHHAVIQRIAIMRVGLPGIVGDFLFDSVLHRQTGDPFRLFQMLR